MDIRNPIRAALCAALLIAPFAAAQAGEADIVLKDGSGKDRVQVHCMVCHSTDYIVMNSPFLDRKGWEATVAKMIKVMGAPIPDEDARLIVDYLVASYGKAP